jgi:hypothetical protein
MNVHGQHVRDRAWAFSSAEMLIGVGLLAAVLGAYSQFGIWGAAPVSLAVAVFCIFVGHRFQRRVARWAGRILIVPALPATLWVLVLNVVLGQGPLLLQFHWPRAVEQIAKIAGDDLAGAKVYSLGGLLPHEHVWRQHIPRQNLGKVIDAIKLQSVSNTKDAQRYLQKFPASWRPEFTANCEFYTPDGVLEYEGEGERWIVMYDSGNEWLYVWRFVGM